MLKKYTPLLLLMMLFASCFKYINIDNGINYTITGFQDITIDQNDSTSLYINVELFSGDPTNEYIHCVVSGLPDSVSINYDSLTFRPNYSFALVFYAHYPTPGVYPVSMTVSSPSMGTKVYKFNLTVTSLIDCTQLFSAMATETPYTQVIFNGNTAIYDDYAFFSRTGCDTMSVEVIKDSAYSVGVDPINELYQFSVSVNCNANTLTIYPQQLQYSSPSQMIRGSGTFAPTFAGNCTITLNDTIYSGNQIISTSTISSY